MENVEMLHILDVQKLHFQLDTTIHAKTKIISVKRNQNFLFLTPI